MLGYGFLLGWSSILVWTAGFITNTYSNFEAHLLRLCFIVAAALALPIISSLSKKVKDDNNKKLVIVKFVVIVLFSSLAIIAVVANVPFRFSLVLWVLSGVPHALLIYEWHKIFIQYKQRRLIMIMGGGFVICGLILIAYYLLAAVEIEYILALPLPTLSMVMCLVARNTTCCETENMPPPQRSVFNRKKYLHHELSLSVLCNIFVGICASCATSAQFKDLMPQMISFAFFLEGLTMLWLTSFVRKNLAFLFLGLFLPFTVLQLLLFAFLPIELKAFSLTAMVFILSCFEVFSTSNLSRNAKYLFSNCIGGLSGGRAANRTAFAIGWIIGYIIMIFWFDSSFSLALTSSVLICILTVGITIRFYRIGLIAVSPDLKSNNSLSECSALINECDTLASSIPVDKALRHEAVLNGMSLDDAVCKMAGICHLSQRETEVFGYLAHGRSLRYISENLVLSINTIRSHTYNIYGKLDVHSRRELNDLIDKYRVMGSF